MQRDSVPSFHTSRKSLTAKALTISAIGMGVGFGTCGLGVITAPNRLADFLVSTGAILFFGSFTSLVITALIAFGFRIAEYFRK